MRRIGPVLVELPLQLIYRASKLGPLRDRTQDDVILAGGHTVPIAGRPICNPIPGTRPEYPRHARNAAVVRNRGQPNPNSAADAEVGGSTSSASLRAARDNLSTETVLA